MTGISYSESNNSYFSQYYENKKREKLDGQNLINFKIKTSWEEIIKATFIMF